MNIKKTYSFISHQNRFFFRALKNLLSLRLMTGFILEQKKIKIRRKQQFEQLIIMKNNFDAFNLLAVDSYGDLKLK